MSSQWNEGGILRESGSLQQGSDNFDVKRRRQQRHKLTTMAMVTMRSYGNSDGEESGWQCEAMMQP